MQVEQVDFVSVPTRDIERAIAFYRDVLGLPQSTVRHKEIEAPNVTIAFWDPARNGQEFAPDIGGFAIRVADVAAARRELEEKGVEFLGETLDTGFCHMAFFTDPDGNKLILHRRYAPREP